MSLAVRVLEETSLLQHLAEHLHCNGPPSALRTAIIAEHIRTLVFAPFAATPHEHPIHTGRLVSALNRNTRFLARPTDNQDALLDEFAFVREQLTQTGDVVPIGDGYWLPTPIRAVRVATDLVYIFGGAPLSELTHGSRGPIEAVGVSRSLKVKDAVAWPTLSLAQWLEHNEPLATWREKTLTQAARELAPQADIEDDGLEIYAPDLYRVLQRPGFWAPTRDFREGTPTLRLFRPKTAPQWVFNRPDYLGIFRPGPQGAQLLKAVRIAHDVARRLQFGLDQVYQTPRTLILRHIAESYRLEVEFPPFPEPEARILGLGWRERGDDNALYFAPSALPALRGVTDLLGMRLYHA
jgi:hypothetical protein